MPKRDGMDVTLIPHGLDHLPASVTVLYCLFQTLNKHNDIERDGLAVFIVGPKEWRKLVPITKKSAQTMKRWLNTLVRAGWASVERTNKDTLRVTLYADPGKKGHRYGHTKEAQGQSHTAQQ